MSLPLPIPEAPAADGRLGQPSLIDLGLTRRLGQLVADDGNMLIVGFDHAISHGALPGLERLPELAAVCLTNGADALQVPPGGARWLARQLGEHPEAGLVLRLDRSSFADDSGEAPVSSPIAGVEDAERAGAQAAVVCYLEHACDATVADRHAAMVGAIAARCRAGGMPLMVEALAVGERNANAVLRVARIAFELGADLLKVDHPGDDGAVRELIAAVGAPVLLRGGPASRDLSGTLRALEQALEAGVRGVVIGRTVWQSRDPAAVLGDVCRAVHGV